MNFKLRPKGKPCLRSSRGVLAAVAGVACLIAAPAAGAQTETLPPAWYSEAGIPAEVDLAGVASNGSKVVAIGTDSTGRAVIYERGEDEWTDATPASVPAQSQLVDVVAAGAEFWAVGHSTTDAGTAPLVLKRGALGWVSAVGALPATTKPTAVAVGDGVAVIGDDQGKLHRLSADGSVVSTDAIAAGRINDISLLSGTTGFAVADWEAVGPTSDTFARIYELKPDPMLETADAGASGTDVVSVAATSETAAVAIDALGGTWRIANGEWRRNTGLPAAALPLAVAAKRTAGDWVHELVAGSVGSGGAIWRRKRQPTADQTWTADTLPAATPPLTGVAVDGADAAWAVGLDGTVLHYWRMPVPPPVEDDEEEEEDEDTDSGTGTGGGDTQTGGGDTQSGGGDTQTGGGNSSQSTQQQSSQEHWYLREQPASSSDEQVEEAPEEPSEAEQSSASRPAPRRHGVEVEIDDSAEGAPAPTDIGRLLKDLKVRRKRGALVITFRLTERARVAAIALRGDKLAGRTRLRTMPKGKGKLVLRFKGKKPPSNLKLVVKPVKA